MLEKIKKGVAVFMSFILVFAVFGFVDIQEVSAAQPYCCIKSNDGQYCIQDDDRSNLEGRCLDLRTGACDVAGVSECKEVTCVPPNGVCLSDYPEVQCLEEGGNPKYAEESAVSECQVGCCKETSSCGLIQKTQCSGQFDSSITDVRECYNQCAASELGCCWETGSCEYGKRGDCSLANFDAGNTCDAISHCDALYDQHSYTACGDNSLIANSALDVYWYDSNGNMMEKVGEPSTNGNIYPSEDFYGREDYGECEYPDEKCYDPDGKGNDNAYCKSTACVASGVCDECEPQTFLNGESICLSIFKGHFTNEAKSSYLHEYVLTCVNGEVRESQELKRSESVCIDGSKEIDGEMRKHARTISNNWAACNNGEGSCGDGGGIFDYGGYIPVLGAIPMSTFGSWCEGEGGLDVALGAFNGDTCEDFGKIEDYEMCYYDNDFWAPIGSCNAKYPPAGSDRCGTCGDGGDGATNMCTEQECNALGDCEFRPKGLDLDALVATGALAMGGALFFMSAAQILCNIPFVSPEKCFGASLGAVKKAFGSQLFWGVFSMVVGLGAGSAQGYSEISVYDFTYEKAGGGYDLAQFVVASKAVADSFEESVNEGSALGSKWTYGDILPILFGLDKIKRQGDTLPLGAQNLGIGIGSLLTEEMGKRVLKAQMKETVLSSFGGKSLAGETVDGVYDSLISESDVLGYDFSAKFVDRTNYYLPRTGQVTEGAVDHAVDRAMSDVKNDAVTKEIALDEGSKFAKVLNVAGIMYSVFSASEAFQTGECVPETKYTNNERCEQCGSGEGQFFCTEKRCQILGAPDNCRWEPKEDGVDGYCLPKDPADTSVPSIRKIHLEMYDINGSFVSPEYDSRNNKLNIDNAFDWNEANTIKLNITTDDSSNCAADFDAGTSYGSMDYVFEDAFSTTHYLEFNLTESIKSAGEATLYLKCENVNGMMHEETEDINWVKLKFGERPDKLPPEFRAIDPYNSIFLSEDVESVPITLTVFDNNGVEGCRYDTDNESNYDEMTAFTGGSNVNCPGSLANDCQAFSATFGLEDGEGFDLISSGYEDNGTIYNYLFSCVDRQGNQGDLDYSFVVYPGFKMNLTAPEEGDDVYDRTPQINISTSVMTQCMYRIDGAENWTEINEMVDKTRYIEEVEDELSASLGGELHQLDVRCRDVAYNYQEKSVSFYVLADAEDPYPVRIYTTGTFGSGNLHIILNEKAECRFDAENEDFDFEDDGTLMRAVLGESIETRLLSKQHVTSWNEDIYYIKCSDEWDNVGGFTVYP